MRRLMITFAAAVAVTLAGAGTAWADAGSGPAQQANCVGMANAGGGNGVFVSQLATSSPKVAWGTASTPRRHQRAADHCCPGTCGRATGLEPIWPGRYRCGQLPGSMMSAGMTGWAGL
jgi:hypothetical protein